MRKFVFNVFSLPILLCSCSMKTNITGEFIFDNSFRAMKEFIGETECVQDERWFKFESVFELHPDSSYSLKLVYFDDTEKFFSGTYHVFVGEEGHSGSGYFYLNDDKINLFFKESYFLIFELPQELNPSGYLETRTIHFQRW